ncbi:MAG: glycosyltransferase, partial [Opitutaceae bacterium]|nr:glycosyltransferase [Opitutaceae bacterium]
ADLSIYSLWGGGGTFCGLPVHTFNKWRLLELLWIIPWVAITRWDVFGILLRGLLTRRAPSWLNFWENMLGAGFAGVFHREFRKNPPMLIHAAWSGAPATAAWCLWRMHGIPYSAAAHAYDIYEHGGDWWLCEKLAEARFVHTSTMMGRNTLVKNGVRACHIHVIRRGLDAFPVMNALRPDRRPIRIVSVGRLVEKKGFDYQMRIHAALRDAGVAFEARIIGDGPLRARLEEAAARANLAGKVTFLGHFPLPRVWEQLQWADVLFHTGIVARSGDRDGLPNVIPEAMAAGVLVITSSAAATTEAVRYGETGLVADVADIPAWVAAVRRLATDDVLAESLRAEARRWTEENFDAHKNAAQLYACFELAAQQTPANIAPISASTPASTPNP